MPSGLSPRAARPHRSSPRPAAARRIVLFALLYASEGAPIGFIWWALPTILRLDCVPVDAITSLTAVLVLPWTLKFLWAPLVDMLRAPWWGYRAWIVAAQCAMAATLVPLTWLDPATDFGAWRTLLLAHALAAATQDVAIDALAVGSVPIAERGRLNGAMQAGMLTGRSLFGGGAVALVAWSGLSALIGVLVAWIVVALTALWRFADVAPEPSRTASTAGSWRAISDALHQRSTWLGLAFALTSGAGFEATGQLAGPFLVDRGAAETTIGAFLGLGVVGAMLTGGLIGGALADRGGRRRVVSISLVGFVAMIAMLALADRSALAAGWLGLTLLAGMYLFVGGFIASSYALFMDLKDRRIGATQFTTFMAATNGCESWSAWTGGRLAAAHGYPTAFLAMCVVSLASLVLVSRLRPARASGAATQETAGTVWG